MAIVRTDKISQELEISRYKYPKVGSIIVFNERSKFREHGMYRKAVERRGCMMVTNTDHPTMIIGKLYRTPGFQRDIFLNKRELAIGLVEYKEVKQPYYSAGNEKLTWEEFELSNF